MLYRVKANKFSWSQFESWDGVVIRATPAFLWAIGKSVEAVIFWLDCRDITWQLWDKPSPLLQELPSDQKLLKKVSP